MCADDHQLFSVAKTTNEAESILTEEGNKISEWYSNNFLQGNFFKNQVTSLGPRSCHKDLHIVINDTVIDQKPEITLLGAASQAGVFREARFSSLPTNACSTEDNIPFPCLANHIVLSKFWKVNLDRKVIW